MILCVNNRMLKVSDEHAFYSEGKMQLREQHTSLADMFFTCSGFNSVKIKEDKCVS